MPAPVLILGGEPRVAVTVARSLQRQGVPVGLATFSIVETRVRSRSIREYHLLPSYRQTPAECTRELLTLIGKHRYETLVPISDTALSLIADHYEELLPLARPACPGPDALRRVLDKASTMEIARRCGMAVPAAHRIANAVELDALGPTLGFPLVVKPESKAAENPFKVRYVHDLETLKKAFHADPSFGLRNLIQEFLTGEGVGVGALIHEGNPIALFQHRRLKEFPATGGVSVMAVSEPLDPALRDQALALLRAIGWEGVAMVEFKHDRSTGRAALMEVNGRHWGTISLAVQAGVDFPAYEWRIGHGQPPNAPGSYRTGMRWRWGTGDMLRLHDLIRRPNPDATRRFSKGGEAVRFLLDFRPGTRSALWSIRDPAPAWSEFVQSIKPLVKEEAGRIAHRVLPRTLVERLRAARALPDPARRIYLTRQAKRAMRLRRDGASNIAPGTRSVLFICHGNIIRSPMGEALLRSRLSPSARETIRISSAGTHARDGKEADPRAIEAAKELGIDLGLHRARRATPDLLRQVDLVVVMDFANEARILALAPETSKRILLLGALADRDERSSIEIPDPYAGELADVRRCYEALDDCVGKLAAQLVSPKEPA